MILNPRMAVQDQTIPAVDELLNQPEYKRLTGLPSETNIEPESKKRKPRVATPA